MTAGSGCCKEVALLVCVFRILDLASVECINDKSDLCIHTNWFPFAALDSGLQRKCAVSEADPPISPSAVG